MKLNKLGRAHIIKWIQTFITAPSYHLELCESYILSGPGGELIVDVVLFQEGRSSKFRLRRGAGQAHTLAIIPTSRVLEFIVHE
jgi:hypothetical protein